MNGFKEHGLDERNFGVKAGSMVSAFDAFRTSYSYYAFTLFWEAPSLSGLRRSSPSQWQSDTPLTSSQPRRNPST